MESWILGEDETNRDNEEHRDSGDEEVTRSMRKMKTQEPDSADNVTQTQQNSISNSLMMAVLDKYRDWKFLS